MSARLRSAGWLPVAVQNVCMIWNTCSRSMFYDKNRFEVCIGSISDRESNYHTRVGHDTLQASFLVRNHRHYVLDT